MYTQRHDSVFFVCVLMILVTSFVSGQATSPADRQRIMREQDVKAAGSSGDKSFIPYLKDVMQSRKMDHQQWDDVQMALAKLGDQEQQQQIVCVFYRGDAYEAQRAGLRQLPYIGGWFAIQVYRMALSEPRIMSHWFDAAPKDSGDEAMSSPVDSALLVLPKLIPALPRIKDHQPVKEIVITWGNQISEHQDELSKLVPTGEGVDFSGKTCKSKPRERLPMNESALQVLLDSSWNGMIK